MKIAWSIFFLLCACNGGGVPLQPGECSTAGTIAECEAIAGCMALTCPGCNGLGPSFAGCVVSGSEVHGPFCGSPCANVPPCANVTTAAGCDARTDCHSIFSGDLPCDSSACSNHFERCEDGATAACSSSGGGNGFCTMLTPTCAPGDSLAFFANGCPLGCVHADRCAP